VEKIVPISAINRLIIEGYSLRDNMDTNLQKNKTHSTKQKDDKI